MGTHPYLSLRQCQLVAPLSLILFRGLLLFLSIRQASRLALRGSATVGCPLGTQRTLPQTPSDNGKASASMNVVSRERFVPLDAAADAATPTYLLATNLEVVHRVHAIFFGIPPVFFLRADLQANRK